MDCIFTCFAKESALAVAGMHEIDNYDKYNICYMMIHIITC